jgi:hypothetical protein
MNTRAKALLAPDKGANKRALHEKGEHPFHRERLLNHAARVAREVGLVGPDWNSIGTPVTTPTAKLSPNIFAQNRAATL